MKLAARLTAFFLIVQGVILAAFSLTIYFLTAHHLSRQVDERLDASLLLLASAAEIEPAGIKWEPEEREHGLQRDAGPDGIQWVVLDPDGGPIDRSTNLDSGCLIRATAPDPASLRSLTVDGRQWRERIRKLSVPETHVAPENEEIGGDASRRTDLPATLTLFAFAPLDEMHRTLQRMQLTLVALSLVVWTAAAFAGRRLCERFLAPLTQMAAAAAQADAADPSTRLPLPETADEQQELGKAFNGLLERLHEAHERQRRFTGDASHQLRTPLTGLLSQVDVVLRRERPPEEYQRVLTIIRTKANQLRQIIEALLFLARTEADAQGPGLERVELANWCAGHLRTWSAHARAGDIHTDFAAEAPLYVRAHPPLLSQLLDNLLENACKYSEPQTPIALRIEREPGIAVLAIEDRGVGLSSGDLARIFEPFYRAPGARVRGNSGVGLGLAVARRVATVFGGGIRVRSEPGVGSRFEVRLPLCDEMPGREQPPSEGSVAPLRIRT